MSGLQTSTLGKHTMRFPKAFLPMKTTITLTLLGGIAVFGLVSTSASPSFAATNVEVATEEPEEPEGKLVVSSFVADCETEVPERFRACGQATVAGPFATPTTAREWREELGLTCETRGQSTDEDTFCSDDWLKKKGDVWVRF
jgi:hypothetical protein